MFFLQMSGVPGSGKSALTKAISEVFNVVVVDHDVTKTALLEKTNGNLSNKIAGQVSYHIDWSHIEFQLSQKHNVIFDSPCLYEEMIEKGMALAQKYNSTYKYIECINEDFYSVSDRLQTRNRKISQITRFESYDKFKETLYRSKRPPHGNFLIVDSSKPINTYINDVVNYMNNEQAETKPDL